MKYHIENYEEKRIERTLSRIGAKIADVTDLSERAKDMLARLESTLASTQKEIEELYISLGNNDDNNDAV